ncbi:MAG: hypothetical protein JSY10_08265 [Paenibacillus sp.]|nr:hypothetical protein [Paenibacillus sp.]
MRNNWARADTGTPAIMKTAKTKTPSHTIIGAIYASSIIHVAIKKPPPKKRERERSFKVTRHLQAKKKKKRKVAKDKKNTIDGFIIEEPAI